MKSRLEKNQYAYTKRLGTVDTLVDYVTTNNNQPLADPQARTVWSLLVDFKAFGRIDSSRSRSPPTITNTWERENLWG